MPLQPPIFGPQEFVAIQSSDADAISRHFAGHIRSLHSFLNQVPCLSDIQKVRRRWKARVASTDAFGTFATQPQHWYSFHHGGRNEAQFNIGMFVDHLRIGLGFEFSQKKGGDPTVVHLVYTCFLNHIRSNLAIFQQFVNDNQLEVEYFPLNGHSLVIIPSTRAVELLLDPPSEPSWLFLGRLLRSAKDAEILENSAALGEVMQRILCGFRPIWEQTQLMAKI